MKYRVLNLNGLLWINRSNLKFSIYMITQNQGHPGSAAFEKVSLPRFTHCMFAELVCSIVLYCLASRLSFKRTFYHEIRREARDVQGTAKKVVRALQDTTLGNASESALSGR